jgi:hypothetical protein
MRRFFALLLLALPLVAGPARAADPIPVTDPPLATPKPHPQGLLPIEVAQQRVRKYLDSVPGMPKDVVVVPATGLVPWPTEHLEKDVRAEVWCVVPRVKNDVGSPIMMFAVRTDTGEVFALYLRDLQKEPVFK